MVLAKAIQDLPQMELAKKADRGTLTNIHLEAYLR
jgi:hypothetical protein